MMELSASDYAAARAHLLGEDATVLIRFMAHQSVGSKDAEFSDTVAELAQNLGWIDPDTGLRTTLGILISDSCREYLFWKERDQRLPFEDALPHLVRTTFQGKYIAEIGAGMGVNLMSLAGTADQLCGVEPVVAYAQMGQIFRDREGTTDIDIKTGGAEDLPFADQELDLVLCVSAHQYFDIHPALAEIARVTKPGGELIIIGNTLGHYSWDFGKQVIRSRGRGLKSYVMTLVNTLSYQLLGRRVLVNRSGFSTARPIYPAAAAMTRWLHATGFETLVAPQRAENETCFYVRRKEDH